MPTRFSELKTLAKISKFLMTLLIALSTIVAQLPAFACATCGCSEICPITAMDSNSSTNDPSLLSNSIWGNIILKMAYAHDPQLQRLAGKLKLVNFGTTSAYASIAGGTIGQTTVAMATLNPPDGHLDSYTAGIVGLGLSTMTMILLGGKPLVDLKYKKQFKAHQTEIRNRVEAILQHLEYSETKCSESQKELAELIGDRGAKDCIQLWQSSHQVAVTESPKISTVGSER